MGLAIIDIDGVLADVRHRLRHVERRPKDWDAFFAAAPQDTPLTDGLQRAVDLADRGDVVYLTGRPERCRHDTETWLADHGFPRAPCPHAAGPRPPSGPATSSSTRSADWPATADVDVVVDDDQLVVDTLAAAGFAVEHAQWMPETKPQQASLLDAQEREGRT